mmetsp:Transcript_3969/g.13241  ORF Transcript_3969/g.13241 Transcript_3969/m.13241 type:complete len:282 (-) Transcript_3969:68-913(-)
MTPPNEKCVLAKHLQSRVRLATGAGAHQRRGVSLLPRSTAGGASAAPSSGDDAGAASTPPPPGLVKGFVRGLRGRMAADANFPFKLGAEVTLDEFMTVLVNVGVRGDPTGWLLGDKLQVLCQMLTAAVNDVILVYCLAPVKDDGSAAAAKKEKSAEPEIAHVFQEGDFTTGQRIRCYLDKGKFYAGVGALSCTLSMFLALALSGQMQKITPEYLFRALMTGALHMGISANTRYQIVNGIERVLFSVLPNNVAKAASVVTRLLNNLLGARLWIVMTTVTGLA